MTRRFNPLVMRLGLVGGARSPWALVEHVGRRSGHRYRTPVLPMRVDDWMVVPLPYGTDADWVRNVRTAGHCRMQRGGTVFELDEPAVIAAVEHPGIPEWYRARLARRGRHYLRLHVLAAAPGTLDSVTPAAPGEPLVVSPAPA